MKRFLTTTLLLSLILSGTSWLSAQNTFTIRYNLNDGNPQIISGTGINPATVAFGGNKLGTVSYVTNSGANALQAPIVQNNATNYNTNFIQMDIAPSNGYEITVSNIRVRHRSNEINNTNFFRIGCTNDGAKPATNNTDESTGNLTLSDSYITTDFSPGSSANTANTNDVISAFLTARGNTNTTFNWYIDYVEITGTYEANTSEYAIEFSLDDFKGSQVTKWGWDLKGSSVNDTQAPVYYGTDANIVRFPIFAPSHFENGTIDMTLYTTKLSQLKNVLALRPDVKVFISLKLSGTSTFPDWVGSNENGNIFGNTVKKPDPDKYSTLLADFLQFMDDEGIPIHYFAPGNEVALALDAPRHYQTMILLRQKLVQRGLSNNFKVIGPDAYSHTETQDFMDDYETDDTNLEYIDILGTHYYASQGNEQTWKNFKDSYKKPVWYTEAGFGPLNLNGSATFPAMAGLRKRFAQVSDAINGGANNIIYWQGAGDTSTSIFNYFKVNLIDMIMNHQPVISDIGFWGQSEDHFNVPFFQTFRNGQDVIIFAINPRTTTLYHTIKFDKTYNIGTVNKQEFLGTLTTNGYSSSTQNFNGGSTNNITTTYPATSITVYKFQLPNSLFETNNAPVVRTGQSYNYTLTANSSVGDIVGKVLVDDNNANEITYSITGGSGSSAFEIGDFSGLITLADPSAILSGTSNLSLNIVANDSKTNSAQRTVTIQVTNTVNTSGFIPDPNKTYYIDSPAQNVRIASTGESEDAYTTLITATGADVEWKFVQHSSGNWHIQRAAGGTKPRLRTDNTADADMNETSASGSYTYYDFTESSSSTGNYFLTLPNGPVSYKRLQINSAKQVKMVASTSTGTWVSFRITEASNVNDDFYLVKRNANTYAINGGSGAVVDRSLELFTYVQSNNLVWTEIDRGNGFYSYQKKNTNVCMDGGSGGNNGQDVTLQTCNTTDVDQQWEKIDAGSGHYRLQKRGTNFSLDGGAGGNNEQNVYLWTSSTNNQNQQWRFDSTFSSSNKSASGKVLSNENEESLIALNIYPNPVKDKLTIQLSNEQVNSAAITIHNLSGQKILSFESNEKSVIDMSNFNSGIYLLTINDGNYITTKKIIKL